MTGLTATVLFAGAGLETEALRGLGIDVTEAINHDALTVETHQMNHPDTRAICADITLVRPSRRYLTDVLAASPSCTAFTRAQGKRGGADQYASDLFGAQPDGKETRALMWDVIKFVEAARSAKRKYRLVFVENVAEIHNWVLWPAWRMAMRALGYQLIVVSRSAAFDTGQDRQRSYILAVPDGQPLPDVEFTPTAPCRRCETDVAAVQAWRSAERQTGKWGEYYDYRCPGCRQPVAPYAPTAADILDVDQPGRPIGSPSRLTKASTERAARAFAAWGPDGLRRHPRFTPRPGSRQADALTVSYYSSKSEQGWPIQAPVRTLTTVARHALLTWPHPDAELGDCGYRMITVAEARRLQGVPEYYRFAGETNDAMRMIGNGVPIPTVQAVMRPAVASLLEVETAMAA